MKQAIVYPLFALALLIGCLITWEYYWFIGSAIVSVCAYYWIEKECGGEGR